MISKQRIAEIVLELAAQGDPHAQKIIKQADKPRIDKHIDIDIKTIEPHLLPYLLQEKNRYFTARALNHFIFNEKNETEKFRDNIHWIRGCSKLLISIFGQPISRNRFNTRLCRIEWKRKKNISPFIVKTA